MLITPRGTKIPMIASWVLRRLGFAVIVLLVVIVINFIIIVCVVKNLPFLIFYQASDYWSIILEQYGLDPKGSWWELFWQYLKNCLTFNFGYSFYSHY